MAVQSTVESADAAPTAQSYTVFDELNGRLETQLAAWRDVQSKDLAALNALIEKNNIPAIAPATEKAKESAEETKADQRNSKPRVRIAGRPSTATAFFFT